MYVSIALIWNFTGKILVKVDKNILKFHEKEHRSLKFYSVAQLFVRSLVYEILSFFYSKMPSFAASFIEYGHVQSF